MSSCLDEALHHCVMGIWNMGCKNHDSSSRKQLATRRVAKLITSYGVRSIWDLRVVPCAVMANL